MSTVTVYEPCARCQGQGWTIDVPPNNWTNPILCGTRVVCDVCHGTGKGKVKEIREGEQA